MYELAQLFPFGPIPDGPPAFVVVVISLASIACAYRFGATRARRRERRRLDSRLKNDAAEIARGRWLRRRK